MLATSINENPNGNTSEKYGRVEDGVATSVE